MPTTVESIAKLGAVLVQLPHAPASRVIFEPNDFGGRNSLLPAVQSQGMLIGLLRSSMPQITQALHQTLPAVQRQLEIFGVGTSPGIIAVLIGLLRDAGYSAHIASCDGSVRPGFSAPTAVIRAVGGNLVASQFLQQVGASRQGH